jgi:DNA-binding NarL/FixJ family response regulator
MATPKSVPSPNGETSKGDVGTDPISVMIASRRRDLAAALLARLASDVRFRIIGNTVRSPARLVACLGERRPRVLLLDEPLFDVLTARTRRMITGEFPDLRVLLACDRANSDLVETVMRHGFHGLLLTSLTSELWSKAIRRVGRGELWLPRALVEEVLLEYVEPASSRLPAFIIDAKLTRRESQTVEQLCKGLTNKQIARKLGIEEDTVKKHLQKVYGKLGVRNRSQLIADRATR